MKDVTLETALYLGIELVKMFNGDADAARAHIEEKKAAGKSFDQILDELQAERQQGSKDAGAAIDRMM